MSNMTSAKMMIRFTAFLLVSGAVSYATQAEFKPAINLRTDGDPISVVAADFNRDGIPDLAVLSYNSNDVSVLLGVGDGHFQPARTYAIGIGSAVAMVGGDFNADGATDLAVSASESLIVLLANPDGTLQPPVSYPLSSRIFGIATSDFNDDSIPDVAVAEMGSGEVAVFLGNGDGRFQSPTSFPAGRNVQFIAAGDLNGDGNPDLIVTHVALNNTLGVLVGNGDGGFGSVKYYSLPAPAYGGIRLADVNNDGKLDVFVGLGNGTIVVTLGNGDGSLQFPRVAVNGLNGAFTTADLNGDGLLDLAVLGTLDSVSVFLGNGDATFVAPASYTVGLSPHALAAADLDSDGYLDLSVTNNSLAPGAVAIVLNAGTAIPVTLSPITVTFGPQTVGTTSVPQAIKLTNTSSETLSISEVSVTGDFLVRNKCGDTVAPGASCNLTVQFRPKAGGTRKGTVSITDSAPSSPQKIRLIGTGE